MFNRQKKTECWKLSETVLGQEGNFVLVRHSSFYQRCHPCHLMKVVQGIPTDFSEVTANDKDIEHDTNNDGSNNENSRYKIDTSDEDVAADVAEDAVEDDSGPAA